MSFETENSIVPLPLKLIWLVNCLPPYSISLFKALSFRFSQFRTLLSVEMEPGRPWAAEWDGLDVRVQKTLSWRRMWTHPGGFSEPILIHVPYDTLFLLKSFDPDVVISSEMGWRTLQALAYRRYRPKSRLLVRATVSEVSEKGRGRAREYVRRKILSGADAVMVNGRSGARYLRRFNVPEGKLFVTPSTTGLTDFTRPALTRAPQSSHRLIYVGQLIDRKGLIQFAQALARYGRDHSDRSIQWWIVGDGPLRDSLSEIMYPPSVTVRFWGNVGYECLPEIYAQAGILTFPTIADEWGMVVNEALAAGVPVLGSIYSQAVEDLIQDGINGWTFRPDNDEDILSALARALGTSTRDLEAMRHSARASVQGLTPEIAADRVVEIVRSVCS